MSDRRAVIAIVGSALLVIALVLVIVFVAIIPIPDFDELRPGVTDGRIAFVTESDDCVMTVDLQLDTTTELTCDYPFPEGLAWSRDGIEVTVFSGGPEPLIITLDPVDGTVLEETSRDPSLPPSPAADPLVLRRGRDDGSSIVGPDGTIVLTLEGPETYVVETAVANHDETWIVFVDSLGRLATFEIGAETVYLIAEGVRSFPTPVWGP